MSSMPSGWKTRLDTNVKNGFVGRAFDRGADQDPAEGGVAILRAWLEPQRIIGERLQPLEGTRAARGRQEQSPSPL